MGRTWVAGDRPVRDGARHGRGGGAGRLGPVHLRRHGPHRVRSLGACEPVGRDVLELPPFVRVNVAAKALEAMDGSGRKTAIHSSALATEKARLILQGGENGRAWSLVIDQKTGEMTAAVADHDGGFLIAGVCTLP